VSDRRKLVEEATPSFLKAMKRHRELKEREEIELEKSWRETEAKEQRLREAGMPEEYFTGGGMSDLTIFPGSMGNMLGQLAWDAVVANRPELAFLSLSPALFSRAGRNLGKIANVEGGVALSKRAYTKGYKGIMKDPMFKDLPLEYSSPLVKHYKPGEIDKATGKPYRSYGSYNPRGGTMYDFDPLLAKAGVGGRDVDPMFKFRQFPITGLIDRSIKERAFPKKWFESTIRHEGRHRQQNVEGAKVAGLEPSARLKKKFDPATFYQHEKEYATLISPSKFKPENKPDYRWKDQWAEAQKLPKEKFDKIVRYNKHITYLSKPIEIEARIEEIVSGTGAYQARKDIKLAGYTDKQIDSMIKEYRIEKERLYPTKSIPEHFKGTEFEDMLIEKHLGLRKKAKGGYIPDSKVFSYVANV
jgi:hypothetical protein